MKRLFVFLATVLLAACATHPPRPGEIRPVPADRTIAFQAPSDGDATIVVTRDKGFAGSGCYLGVFIDAKESARLGTGERATFHVPNGHHVVGTWPSGAALCSYRNGKDRIETDGSVKAGEVRKYRIQMGNGGLTLTPTTFD
jgi:hypothetical protein